MEQNQAVKRRRDLVTSLRGSPRGMLHLPMENRLNSIVRSLRGFAAWFRSFASPHLAKLRLRTPPTKGFTPQKQRAAFSAQDDTLNGCVV